MSEAPSRQDWVVAGLRALADGGIDSVRVERLARDLGVSKGPFYWRFADRTALLSAMLDFWREDFTAQLIAATAHLPSPRARLEALAAASLEIASSDLDVARTEGALRAWAAQDPVAADQAREVDAVRTGHLVAEFALLGAPASQAHVLAQGIYLALLGLYTVRRYTPHLADDAAFASLVRMAMDMAEGPSEQSER